MQCLFNKQKFQNNTNENDEMLKQKRFIGAAIGQQGKEEMKTVQITEKTKKVKLF